MAYLRNSTLITGPNTLLKVSSTLLNSGTSDTLPSSPHFSQSNGFVERAIQTVKKSLKKAHDGNEDLYLTLLILNTTPGADGVFPAMRLFNHQPRTILPSLNMTHTDEIGKVVEKCQKPRAYRILNSKGNISQKESPPPVTLQGQIPHSKWSGRLYGTNSFNSTTNQPQDHFALIAIC